MSAQSRRNTLWQTGITCTLICAITAVVYGGYGFRGELMRDQGNHLYAGQRMAHGVPPYVSIFNHKTPVASLLAGLGVMAARYVAQDDIYTVRLLFFAISCLTVAAVYVFVARLFQSRRVGLIAAATFLCFFPFAAAASAGPQPKTPIVILQVLTLSLTSSKRWFWAGVCGMLAFLTWQPMLIYACVTLVIIFCQAKSWQARTADVLLALAGMAVPLVIVGLYFSVHHALYAFLDGAILFNILYLDRTLSAPASPLYYIFLFVTQGYTTALLPIFLGTVMVVFLYCWRLRQYPTWRQFVGEDRFAPVLLSFPLPILWSLLDFQGKADFYVFLPYVAAGFAMGVDLLIQRLAACSASPKLRLMPHLATVGVCTGLVLLAAAEIRRSRDTGLDAQQEAAARIVQQFGPQATYMSIGAPQFMVILHRVNPNPYVFVSSGIDRHIDATVPGGFVGWVRVLEECRADVIALGPTHSRHFGKLLAWLDTHYRAEQIGPWKIYVRRRQHRS